MKEISDELYMTLDRLGMLPNPTRSHNVGKSNYSKKFIQPWAIILEYGLDYWDGDIVKRVLREKEDEPERLDYEKIIHICQEKLRQIDFVESSAPFNPDCAHVDRFTEPPVWK